ncbi:MAG: enoyl-CoA hydratase family protein [Pseudomonadota bacterium]
MSDATYEIEDNRAIVWNGNAARRGALTPEFYEAIKAACKAAEDPAIRAVILTSRGDFFCAGGDLNVLIESRTYTEADRAARIETLHDVIRAIRNCPVPVIAAVKGGAAGAGASIALACDFIVAEAGVFFTASYVKAGLVPDGGLSAALARMLPRPLAMEMLTLARPIPTDRLVNLGVINVAAPAEDVMPQAEQLADDIAKGPRAAQARIKAMTHAAYDNLYDAQLAHERDAMAWATGAEEAAEGIAAFLEKRAPSFG